MPIVRYQLRNAHAISDPALYTSNGGDEPQDLLRGVAAGGLTGVLRQLGDLAELAAEIFHDLHKDVMSVVARGEGLSLRVQQLETEIPTIEKDFLSQTSHSKLADNEGIDWHPGIHVNNNLVTKGDVPKFILDSYGECRGPPRLFMLDKFDSAGAGACLRRYSDPSFFKTSSFYSKLSQSDYQRENKVPKTKIKVSRPRNDETKGRMSVSDISLKLLCMVTQEGHGYVPEKCMRLKIRPPNYLNEYGEDSDEHVIESYPPELNAFYRSSHSIQEYRGLRTESLSNNQMHRQGRELSSCHEQMEDSGMVKQVLVGETKLLLNNDKMKFHTPISVKAINQEPGHTINKAHGSPESPSTTKVYMSSRMEAVSSSDTENKVDGSTDGYLSADVSSDMETFSYVDALTTSDSECETKSERKLDPEMKSVNKDNHFSEDQAVQGGEPTNLGLNDVKSEVLAGMPVNHFSDLDIPTIKSESPREYEGSMPVLQVGSSEDPKIITALESSDGPKEEMPSVNEDPVIYSGDSLKDADIDVLSPRKKNAAPAIATLENPRPDEGLEGAKTVSPELTHGLTKMPTKEIGSDSDSVCSKGNNARDASSPIHSNLNISGKSRGSSSLSSLPPLPGFASLTMFERSHTRSLELRGVQLNVEFSSPADDALKGSEDTPPLPPLPPAEWRTGKIPFGPSLLGVTSANTQNGSSTLLPIGESSLQIAKNGISSPSMPLHVQESNSMMSESCHCISEKEKGQPPAPSQNLFMEEQELSQRDIPSLNTEMVKPPVFIPTVMSAVENATDVSKHECENKAVQLNTVATVTDMSAGGEAGHKTLQPLANVDTSTGLSTQDHSPSSARELVNHPPTTQTVNVTVKNGSTEKTEKESTTDSVTTSTEVDVDAGVPNEKLNRPRDPLIEAVTSHDKSKLRGVSQVIRISNKPAMDQRNALLEEIRNKAFSLRPTSMARPSIKGPVTNLKYAAILEKASNIRQALAGSDEEDDDSWD